MADEWVTQPLRRGDARVFKKYSQMKLQMKREARGHLNREANEVQDSIGALTVNLSGVLAQFWPTFDVI